MKNKSRFRRSVFLLCTWTHLCSTFVSLKWFYFSQLWAVYIHPIPRKNGCWGLKVKTDQAEFWVLSEFVFAAQKNRTETTDWCVLSVVCQKQEEHNFGGLGGKIGLGNWWWLLPIFIFHLVINVPKQFSVGFTISRLLDVASCFFSVNCSNVTTSVYMMEPINVWKQVSIILVIQVCVRFTELPNKQTLPAARSRSNKCHQGGQNIGSLF